MPKWIVKYKLHGRETPWYVELGGIFLFDGWRYGVSLDDDNCYIPTDVEKMDEKEFKAFIGTKTINQYRPSGQVEKVLNKQEKDALIDFYTEGKIKKDRNE